MARTASIGIRVEPDLKTEIEGAAKADGRTVAQWIERLIVHELRPAEKPTKKPMSEKQVAAISRTVRNLMDR